MKRNSKQTDIAELRRQAEKKLSERRKKTTPPPTTETDTRRLIHELEVHQIELEMQNEELMRSRAEVDTLLRQYTDLYDFAPVGYFTLTRDGTIHQVNLAGANLMGVERGKLIERRFGVFVFVQSRPVFNAFLEKLLVGRGIETCELALLKNGNEPLDIRVEAACFEDGQACRAVMVDITARKQADEALKYLSTHDALTGLYNRGFFLEEMARLERGREFPVSIVMVDVDYLKKTNDLEGHATGDALLVRVAQVLTDAFRAEDVIARIGGDEFAVLLPASDAISAKDSLHRVRQIIQKNNTTHAGTPIRLSIGVSTAKDPAPLSAVLSEADANMYRDKRENDAC